MRKRIVKRKRIDLGSLFPVASADPYEPESDYDDDYDSDEDITGEFDLDKLEKLGIVHCQKITKTIPDGEQAFFSTFKQGEDF